MSLVMDMPKPVIDGYEADWALANGRIYWPSHCITAHAMKETGRSAWNAGM